jgi:addiction module HigA family antidote
MARTIEPTHPGQMLKEDFLNEMGIRPSTLASSIGVDRAAISKILAGKRDITADMSLRLGLFFEQSDGFWLNLQKDYDLRIARNERLGFYKKAITPYDFAQLVE